VGYQLYGAWDSSKNDRQSNTLLSSLAVGWRPSFLNKSYPKPDVRLFWETTGEVVGMAKKDFTSVGSAGGGGGGHTHDVIAPTSTPTGTPTGVEVLVNSGGTAIFTGPSFLWTYKSVAFQGGVLFAALDRPNGQQPHEDVRAVVGFTYYILGHRK
jgi:hypothetical protein